MKETLLQTAIIADQNGGKNVGKLNCGNEELAYLASAIKEGEQVEEGDSPQTQLALNNRRRFFFKFGLPSI